MQIFVLGRLPKLATAELEALYGSDSLSSLSEHVVGIETNNHEINFARLGGSIRQADYVSTLDKAISSDQLAGYIADFVSNTQPKGKVQLGISIIDGSSPAPPDKLALSAKKILKSRGQSVRVVISKQKQLNAAEVLNNKLHRPGNFEFIITNTKDGLLLGQTTNIQDIDAYAKRDHGRPARDSKIGMLPPKLAQTLINLAVEGSNQQKILDPFCGTGVILQEAWLMGYDVVGTDINPRMIQYSAKNVIEWLKPQFPDIKALIKIELADATTMNWEKFGFTAIASEAFLGRPFSQVPDPLAIEPAIREVDQLINKFLQNITSQTQKDFRMCVAVPAWKINNQFRHLTTLESLEELGYTRVSFTHATNQDLIYFRPDQIVARELLVLVRK